MRPVGAALTFHVFFKVALAGRVGCWFPFTQGDALGYGNIGLSARLCANIIGLTSLLIRKHILKVNTYSKKEGLHLYAINEFSSYELFEILIANDSYIVEESHYEASYTEIRHHIESERPATILATRRHVSLG